MRGRQRPCLPCGQAEAAHQALTATATSIRDVFLRPRHADTLAHLQEDKSAARRVATAEQAAAPSPHPRLSLPSSPRPPHTNMHRHGFLLERADTSATPGGRYVAGVGVLGFLEARLQVSQPGSDLGPRQVLCAAVEQQRLRLAELALQNPQSKPSATDDLASRPLRPDTIRGTLASSPRELLARLPAYNPPPAVPSSMFTLRRPPPPGPPADPLPPRGHNAPAPPLHPPPAIIPSSSRSSSSSSQFVTAPPPAHAPPAPPTRPQFATAADMRSRAESRKRPLDGGVSSGWGESSGNRLGPARNPYSRPPSAMYGQQQQQPPHQQQQQQVRHLFQHLLGL